MSLVILVVFFIFWRLFVPGNHLATDLHSKSSIELIEQINVPLAWSDSGSVGMGHYKVPLLWNWPVNFIFGLFSEMGFNYNLMLVIFGYLLSFSLAIYGINKILKLYKIGKAGRQAGILLYLLNSYFILLLDGGQLNLALAYGAIPVGIFYFLNAVRDNSTFIDLLKFGLAAYLVSIFDIRMVYVLIIIIWLLFVSIDLNLIKRIKKYILTGSVAGIILLIFHWYWIYPSIFLRTPSLPGGLGRLSQVEFLSFTKLKHAVSMLQPHWPLNDFGQVANFNRFFLIIPIFIALGIIFHIKKRKIWGWVLIALVFIFLTKGNNLPFGEAYEWLFINVPGFSLFRDSSKFYFGIAMAYSMLIAFSVNELKYRILKFPLTGLFVLILIMLNYPVWTGKMTGTFRNVEHENNYLELNKVLENDTQFGRVLWIPTKAPLGYSSDRRLAVEMNELALNPLFNLATIGKYESFNFLREGNYTSDLLNIYGVKYIIYPQPSELKRELSMDQKDYYFAFSNQIEGLDFIKQKISNQPVNGYELNNNQDLFFIANRKWQIVGDANILSELHDNNVDLSKNILNFTEQGLTDPSFEDVFILYGKNKSDLFFSLMNAAEFIYPAESINFEPIDNGWWKRESMDGVWWRDFLEQKYEIYNSDFDFGGGWIIGEGKQVYSFVAPKNGMLSIRLLSGTKGGVVEIGRKGESGAKIATEFNLVTPYKINRVLSGYGDAPDQVFEYDPSYMNWVYGILKVNQGDEIEIRTDGAINVINAMAIVDQSLWEEFNENYEQLDAYDWEIDKQELIGMMQTNNEVIINYERISPIRYKVNISGMEEKARKYLVFSQNFDRLWELNGQKSQNVYGGLNGFEITQNGEYDLYYSAQDWVNKGFMVSVAGYVLVLGYLVYDYKKK